MPAVRPERQKPSCVQRWLHRLGLKPIVTLNPRLLRNCLRCSIRGCQARPSAQGPKVAVELSGHIAARCKRVPGLDQRMHLLVAPQLQEVQARVFEQLVLRMGSDHYIHAQAGSVEA